MQPRSLHRSFAALVILAALAFRFWYFRKAAKTVLLMTADWGDEARLWTTLASVGAEAFLLLLALTPSRRNHERCPRR
jgi:hypothetical protein